jgi:small subunit ribosomal protein S6
MATAEAEYELVLMLDPETPDERRDQIAADARQRIESGGALKHDTAWGMRKMAFEIRQRTEADYRFFRFESGDSPLLDELNHNLRIADGVLRFRIFKVDPRTPVIVPPPPTPLSAGRPERGSRRDGDRRGRGDGPPRSRGADDDPVAAPVEPVQAASERAEGTAPAEPPAADAAQAPEAPPAEPEAPASDAAPEAPASDDER